MVVSKEVVIKRKTGLHARPAALFVQLANRFESTIEINKNGQKVNGKSIMGLLMLAAEEGVRLIITAEGNDAERAVKELSAMLMDDSEPDFSGNKKK